MSRLLLLLLTAAVWGASALGAFAASSNVNGLTASPAIVGTQLFYCPIGATTDYKCSAAQIAAYNYSLMSGDCTATSLGAITCTKTNGTAFTNLSTLAGVAAGDLAYFNGTTWVRLPGNTGTTNFLSESASGVPSWAAGTSAGVSSFSATCPATGPSTGVVTLTNGTVAIAYSANHTMLASECGATIEATGLTTTITGLTTITSGYQYTVCNENASGGANVTASPGGTNTFNGSAANIAVVPGQCIGVFAGSGASPTNWDVAGQTPGTAPMGPGYVVNDWYTGFYLPGNPGAGSSAPSTTLMYCSPTWIANINQGGGGTGTIGALALNITTLGTSNVQLAIYTNGTNGFPNTLVAATASILDTTTGVKTAALAGASGISQGLYWICEEANDITVRWSVVTNPQMAYLGGNASSASLFSNTTAQISTSSTFGTWPASLSAASWSAAAQVGPLVEFQFSSIP